MAETKLTPLQKVGLLMVVAVLCGSMVALADGDGDDGGGDSTYNCTQEPDQHVPDKVKISVPDPSKIKQDANVICKTTQDGEKVCYQKQYGDDGYQANKGKKDD